MKKKKGTNVYEKKVMLGRNADGSPIRKSITGRTQAELNQRIEEAKQKWMEMNTVSDGILFKTYANRWMTTAKAVRSINTKRMYRETLDRHIIPEIGDLYFSEITLADLQKIINDRMDKYETCNKIRLTLRQIYEAAAEEELVKGVNTKKLVLPPKPQHEKRPLTTAETDAVLNANLPDEQRIYVRLLYYTGMRREEALALEPEDIDFKSCTVRINKVIVFDENTPVLKRSAKSSAGNRRVPIPADFIPELKEYTSKCEKLLFPQQRNPGEYISKSSYNKFWRGIAAELEKITPSAGSLTAHRFRHNYATLLHYAGITPKKAAQLLGDSSIEMVMRIYTHLDEEKERMDEKLNDVFKRKTPQPEPECLSGGSQHR